jgi:hypothetical protein
MSTSRVTIDPKGYWAGPEGNIRRLSGEQDAILKSTHGFLGLLLHHASTRSVTGNSDITRLEKNCLLYGN